MADPDHLVILNQGVEQWNQWRKDNSKVIPNLSVAQLSNADLRGFYLGCTFLSSARLSGANLSGAQLRNADLRGSYLRGALLTGAFLRGADLSRAHLTNVDLRDASLIDTNLSNADLRGAQLSNADFRDANLIDANLIDVDLRGADLSGADLNGADLSGADLSRADFSGANLNNANLILAQFRGTNLSGVDFTSARIANTIIGKIDLSTVKGLETVQHQGPSTIGLDTIYLSEGNIPEVFLRGAGVPENFITFMHSLTGKALEYYSCFIGYSGKDHDFAERLYIDLQAKNIRCWFAPEEMKIGDRVRTRIDEAIRIHDKLLIVISEQSIESTWVEKEVETAFEKESIGGSKNVLFPVRIDNTIMVTDKAWAADIRRTRHIGDFTNWKDHDAYQKAFERLVRDLKSS